MDFYSNSTLGAVAGAFGGDEEAACVAAEKTLTAADVAEIVNSALASLRVYVVESDITSAQNSVRAVVEQATF